MSDLDLRTEVTQHRPDVKLIGTRAGEGPPVLLLHAGGERRQTWAPVAAALAQAGYSSVAYDQRGHGDSRPVNADNLSGFAADVVAMVDNTFDAAPVVVGCSLGGLAALLALDSRLEALVAGLMMVDVVPDPPPERTRAWLARTLKDRVNQPIVDDILGRGQALRAVARRLELPVRLIRGGAGSPVTDDDARRLLELVPHARTVTIPGAGHLIARDTPTELATATLGCHSSANPPVMLSWRGRAADRRSAVISHETLAAGLPATVKRPIAALWLFRALVRRGGGRSLFVGCIVVAAVLPRVRRAGLSG
jgi:pimeloyl-ACP methyl ester carboxylesterase